MEGCRGGGEEEVWSRRKRKRRSESQKGKEVVPQRQHPSNDGKEGDGRDFHLRTVVARRLGDEIDPKIMDLINDPAEDVLLVYPSPDAMSLKDGLEELGKRRRVRREEKDRMGGDKSIDAGQSKDNGGEEEKARGREKEEEGKITLLFLDATWKYAREMERANTRGGHWPVDLVRVRLCPTGGMAARRDGKGIGCEEDDGESADFTGSLDDKGGSGAFDDSVKIKSTTTEGCGGDVTPSVEGKTRSQVTLATASDDDADISSSLPDNFQARRFHIRTPPSASHLSTAECIAWVVSVIERKPKLYETLMKPLDLMVEKWNSFRDNRDGNCERRGFTDGDGRLEDEGSGEGEGKGGGRRRRNKHKKRK